MSSGSVYKNNFIQLSSKNTRVIDPNVLMAKRMEGFTGILREVNPHEQPETSSDDTPDAELLDALTSDAPEAEKEEQVTVESVEEQCKRMLEEANSQAEEIVSNANAEAESIKTAAHDTGYEEGYSEGRDAALAELLSAKKELEDEKESMRITYNERVRAMEPEMVNVITDVYEHVFGANFYSRRDVMVCLINKALLSADTDEQMVIHISPSDYDMLVGMKSLLFEKVAFKSEPEIRQRDDFVKGQAKIETPYGILDCSIDTELKELKRMLKVLSYEGNGEV